MPFQIMLLSELGVLISYLWNANTIGEMLLITIFGISIFINISKKRIEQA